MPKPRLTIQPLTRDRWEDFVRLFGPRGACAGCWCQWWKRTPAEWTAGKQGGNRRAQKRFVESGRVPGLIAYRADVPVGWCAVEPRESYSRLERARSLKRVDATPDVWSVTCFFVAKEARGAGVTVALLKAAIAHARRSGARVVEGYPVVPSDELPPVFAYTGVASAFLRAGFKEVARPSRTRAIMRYRLGPRRAKE